MEKCLVSLIIPVYNVEKYLRKCLDSAINQTLKDIEIIIVNDGSIDSCPSIISEYAGSDDRIKVINQPNMGLSAARNNGLAIASASYISFMDSDDWVDINYLEKLYNEAVRCDADIVVCKHTYVFDSTASENNTSDSHSRIGNTYGSYHSSRRESDRKRSYDPDSKYRSRMKIGNRKSLKTETILPAGRLKASSAKILTVTSGSRYGKSASKQQTVRISGRKESRAAIRSMNISNELMRNDYALRKVISDSGIHSYAWGKIYRKSLFEQYKISYPDGLYFEDMATTFKLFFHARRISIIKDCLYFYLQRKSSISKKLVPKKVFDNITAISLMRQYLEDKGVFMDYYPEYRWLCQKMFLFSAFNLFLMYVRNDRSYMFKSITRTAKEIRSLMTPYTAHRSAR